jgi:hypothetical protein
MPASEPDKKMGAEHRLPPACLINTINGQNAS